MPSVEHVALGKQLVTVNSRPGRLVLPSVKGGALGKKVFFRLVLPSVKVGHSANGFFSVTYMDMWTLSLFVECLLLSVTLGITFAECIRTFAKCS